MTAPDPYGARSQRQGSISARELRGDTRSPRRTGWGGVLFLLVLLVVIGVGAVLILGPVYRDGAYSLARSNPQALRLPFVPEIVRDRLGARLREPAGTSTNPITFVVAPGATIGATAQALADAGFIADPLVFIYHVMTRNLDDALQPGSFKLNKAMTPLEIAQRLTRPPDPTSNQVVVRLKQSLRLEQIAAYLQTLSLQMNVKDFYLMTLDPPDAVVADYPELKAIPKGRSLEGFMGRGTFSVDADITPESLLRELLDRWRREVGPDLVQMAQERPGEFYRAVTLASLVERETGVDGERPKIAGVYVNRLDADLNATRIMNADPTVIYAVDTDKLRKRDFTTWPKYVFWTALDQSLSKVKVPDDLASFQTYVNPGAPDGPIATPTLASLRAVLKPDRKQGYLYFYACPGSQTHVFAKTLEEQQKNIASCKKKRR